MLSNELFVEKYFLEVLTMNKTELVASMADKAGLSKKDAEKALSRLYAGCRQLPGRLAFILSLRLAAQTRRSLRARSRRTFRDESHSKP